MDRRLFLEALAGAGLGGSLLPAESAGLQGGRAFADRDRELSPEGTELETDVLEQHVGLEEDVRPHAVRAKENELEAFQHMLSAEGIPLRWPEEQARTPQ